MKLWPVLLVLALVLPAVAGQQANPVREVAFHQFQPLTFALEDFSGSCETGGIEISDQGRTFQFIEGKDADVDEAAQAPRAFISTGCGVVRKSIEVLPTADHLVIRFQASRERDTYGSSPEDAPLIQDLVIRDGSLRELQSRAIFAPEADTVELAPFSFMFAAQAGGPVSVDWVFTDPGPNQQDPAPNALVGSRLGGTVTDASVEAIGDALDSLVQSHAQEIRDGTRLTTQHRVTVQVPQFSEWAPAVRVRLAPGFDLARVVAPDGTDLGAPSTFAGEVLGLDHDGVVVQMTASYAQAVVPQSLVQAHGAGQYVFVFEESHGLMVSPPLVPVSIILLATPLPFAALAWLESRAFRREAFGGYARSARNLQHGVGLVFLYYVAVVASAAVGGRLDLMAIVPMPLEGVLLYVQLGFAGVAFTALWLVARELYLLVKPRPALA